MTVKLLTKQHLEFLSAQARVSVHLSKYHNVGNHMSRLSHLLSSADFFQSLLFQVVYQGQSVKQFGTKVISRKQKSSLESLQISPPSLEELL